MTDSVDRVGGPTGVPTRVTGPTNERTNELTKNRQTDRTSRTFRNARTRMHRIVGWLSWTPDVAIRVRAALAGGGDESPGDAPTGHQPCCSACNGTGADSGGCATCDAHPAHPDLPEPQPCQPDCTLVHFHWHPDAPVCICPTCARRYAP